MLDLACDIAADKADTALNVWEAVERDIVGHSTVRWMAQVSELLYWVCVVMGQLGASHASDGVRAFPLPHVPVLESCCSRKPLHP